MKELWITDLCKETSNQIFLVNDISILAKWYCMLNTGNWPKELFNVPMFEYLDKWDWPMDPCRENIPTKHDVSIYLMDIIHSKIGKKAVSMYWNCVYKSCLLMTFQEFDFWWGYNYEDKKNDDIKQKLDKMGVQRWSLSFKRCLPPTQTTLEE